MIRPTLPADTEALIAMTEKTAVFRPIEIAALREVLHDYHAGAAGPGHHAITAERDGQPIGFAYFAPADMTDRTWQLWWIVVDPQTHARGVGGQLLRKVEEEIHAANGRLLLIETGSPPQYDKTRRFYAKQGYEQEAVLRDFYADGDDMVVFRKKLGA
jgi:GNAT superfamily N-acetyltransferase